MYGTKLQKWEQITTVKLLIIGLPLLWCMVQSYKNESKSQPEQNLRLLVRAVMYGTKLQKWEQITTLTRTALFHWVLWCMVQSYKNESKSQLTFVFIKLCLRCDVWYKVTKMRANHNGKEDQEMNGRAVMYGTKLQKWEQITTQLAVRAVSQQLWCMVQSYKNESKSQR